MEKKKKEGLSLNQLHNRVLLELSASHSKPDPVPRFSVADNHDFPRFAGIADFDSPSPSHPSGEVISEESKLKDEGFRVDDVPGFNFPSLSLVRQLKVNTRKSTQDSNPGSSPSAGKVNSQESKLSDEGFSADDVPCFDFPSFSPEEDVVRKPKVNTGKSTGDSATVDLGAEMGGSEERGSSKMSSKGENSFESKTSYSEHDFSDSVTGGIDLLETELERRTASLEEDNASRKVSSASGITDFDSDLPGEEKPVKVKVKGRRRLCKMSNKEDNYYIESAGIEISDFDSPIQDKACEDGGSQIRDILENLSTRLETLSIEKRKAPKKVGYVPEPMSGDLYDVDVTEESAEYQDAFSFSSNSSFTAKELKVEGAPLNRQPVKSFLDTASKDGKFGAKLNKMKSHAEGLKKKELMKMPVKSGSAEQFNAFSIRKEVEQDENDDCVILRGRNKGKQVEKRQEKLIDVSDDESEVIDLSDGRADDFSLSGPNGTYRLPEKIAKMLYPHQRDGLKWLWSLHCKGKGGILGDDMGLGKTMQICGFLAGLFHSNLVKRVLVVAPKTLLTHWANELSVVGLSQKTREYFSTCPKTRHYELQYILQDKGVLLTTYDIVRNNVKLLRGDHRYLDDGEEEIWDYMFLDEGHLIKNPSTQRAKSLLEIPCGHRIIISGTPLQNNLKELWALFHFCCPELLGDKNWFKEKYEHSINRGNEKNASEREKRIGSAIAKELREHIQPYFLRRLKSVVFGDDNTLSKKNEMIVWLRLTGCQRQLYEAFLNSEIVVSACDGSPLAAITILKKICDHPLLLTKRAAEEVLEGMDSVVNQEDHGMAEKLAMHIADVAEQFDFVGKHDVSCKISFILSLLGDLIPKGHNVLIFSQTRKMLNLIQETLISNGYNFMRIDGTTKASDRAKIVKEFQEGCGAPIFLLTSQVGGLGLTLTKADRVIVVDPAWNPSTDSQSVDRAYRIGQKKDVIVYRLMTCGTVEEKIYRKQVFKGGLFRSATEHKEQIRYFSQQDLRDLFSLPKHGFDISLTQKQLHEEHDQQHIMEESLKAHVDFLGTLNIAGVSYHSLLFSKAGPEAVAEEQEEVRRVRVNTVMGSTTSRSPLERIVDGADYAFNLKEVKKLPRTSSPASEPSESEIRSRINRLSQIFANKAAISRLPDKGAKIQTQLADLKVQLNQMQMAKGTRDGAIDLDSISEGLRRVVL